MPAVIRRFERRDREQLTALVNRHVAAVVPGVVLSVNAVLGQLEREPGEPIVDPWVGERACLVADRPDGIAAAALLHRFRDDRDVGEGYRNAGEIRWLVCRVDAAEDGARLLDAALDRMGAWRVRTVGADCALPAPGCYGVPDVSPHIRALFRAAGFGAGTRTELVLAARCEALTGSAAPDGAREVRSVGRLGTRLALMRDDDELGFIEVCDPSAELLRSSPAARWADVGDLVVHDGHDASAVVPALLGAGARWLLLGGATRLIDYWAADVDDAERLAQLQRAGFELLTRTERGMTRPAPGSGPSRVSRPGGAG